MRAGVAVIGCHAMGIAVWQSFDPDVATLNVGETAQGWPQEWVGGCSTPISATPWHETSAQGEIYMLLRLESAGFTLASV